MSIPSRKALVARARGHTVLDENHEAGLIPMATRIIVHELADALEADAARIAELEAVVEALQGHARVSLICATAALASGATPPDDVD